MVKPDTPYMRIDAIVNRYVESFDMDDNDTCYTPTEFERAMIFHAIHGLICQEDFMETILIARALTHAARRAYGQHPCCGAGLEHPHYGQCIHAGPNLSASPSAGMQAPIDRDRLTDRNASSVGQRRIGG